MIQDLLTPEAQSAPYLWAAVMVAHAGIGVALWVMLYRSARQPMANAFLAMIVYAAFEALQAIIANTFLLWDSLLDWSAFSLGTVLAASLWRRSITFARLAVLAILVIVTLGAWVRA
jgi:hypothetical protein